jgi:hypothetical protein
MHTPRDQFLKFEFNISQLARCTGIPSVFFQFDSLQTVVQICKRFLKRHSSQIGVIMNTCNFLLSALVSVASFTAMADGAQVSAASARAAHYSHNTGSFRITLNNFAYNVPTWTPALLLNPAITTNYVRISSPNCSGTVSAYAKTNVPAFGFYTMNPMTSVGNKTWYYASLPIRAMQILETQTQWYPIAATCDLVIEPVQQQNPENPGSGECLSVNDGIELLTCQQNNSASLKCELLQVRYNKYGICK